MSYLDNTGLAYLWGKIKDAFAAKSHKHAAGDITSGKLSVSRGGTGVTSNPSMLANLGSTSADSVFKASPRPGVTGTLGIANGGTGATTAADAVVKIVNGQALTPSSIAASGGIACGVGSGTIHSLANKTDIGHEHSADDITSGTLSPDRIPTLPASRISTGAINGDIIVAGTLMADGHGLYPRSSNINRDAANPSSQTDGNSQIVFTDDDNERICQLVPRRNTDGSMTLSIGSVNEKADGTQVYCAIAVTVGKDGSQSYSVSDPAAFRSAIGAAKNTWTQIASVYGGGAMTYSLTGYSEVMFAAYNGSLYMGTCVVPIDLLSSTEREIYLGGGYTGSGSAGRNFAIKATSTRAQQSTATVDGSSITCLWVVFAR